MHSMLDALDALAIALVAHDHQWTASESALYEAATASNCKGIGSSETVRCLHLTPWNIPHPLSGQV